MPRPRSVAPLLAGVALAAMVGLFFLWWSRSDRDASGLVVYCAHDALFSEPILRQFERETGIPVDIRFDTEATKSLGLVERIVRQGAEHPECDVFWNNEPLGTLDLAARGLLDPHRGTAWERMPSEYRAADGTWVGFGARLRVWIYRPDRFSGEPGSVGERLEARVEEEDLSRFAIAMPLYGTTLTHYGALWQLRGEETLKEWHRSLRPRKAQVVKGNAVVKNLVAAGTCDFGWTDTDDAFAALDDGANVAMEPILIDGRPVVIPNTVAVIRGSKRQEAARKLVDYLASPAVELALARSTSRQIPLGPVEPDQLPEEVRRLYDVAKHPVDLTGLLPARNACLRWLKEVETGQTDAGQ